MGTGACRIVPDPWLNSNLSRSHSFSDQCSIATLLLFLFLLFDIANAQRPQTPASKLKLEEIIEKARKGGVHLIVVDPNQTNIPNFPRHAHDAIVSTSPQQMAKLAVADSSPDNSVSTCRLVGATKGS